MHTLIQLLQAALRRKCCCLTRAILFAALMVECWPLHGQYRDGQNSQRQTRQGQTLKGQRGRPSSGDASAGSAAKSNSPTAKDSNAAQGAKPEKALPAAAPAGGSDQINESELVGLPLNGRSYSQLATLQAGVTESSGGSSSRGGGSGSLNVVGGRPTSNNFLLDGTNIMNNDNQVPRSAAGVQLGSDAVLRVLVLTSFYGAEYGRGSGGILNSITRSGTTQFHGTLFEYFRNSKLDARNFFDPGSHPPPFKRNQFGFTLTGPLVKDRTFFMGSLEALRDRLTESKVDFLPDALARHGIITDAAGRVLQTIPVNPSVAPYLNLYPQPNSRSLGGGIGENVAPQFQPSDENFVTVRLDHKITDRDSIFGRYTFDDAFSVTGENSANYLWRQRAETRQQYWTLVGSHIFSTRWLASYRFGYTRPAAFTNTLGADIPKSLYFVPSAPVFGQINIPSLTGIGPAPNVPDSKIMNTVQFGTDVLAQKGTHGLRFGLELHRYRVDTSSSSQNGGIWTFNSLESFLQGGPAGTNLVVGLPGYTNRREFRQTLAGLYLQDDYKLRPRLTVNLGLRYEFASQLRDQTGRHVYLPDPLHDTSPRTGEFLLANNPSKRTFSPRIGFRWSPVAGGDTVFQAGAGIYYDHILGYTHVGRRATYPSFPVVVVPNFDSRATFPDAVSAAALAGGFIPRVVLMDYLHSKTPTIYRYSASVQQHLRGEWDLQIAYVGARGNHLFRRLEANQFPVPVTRPDGSLFFPDDCTERLRLNLAPSPLCRPSAGPVNPAFGSLDFLNTDAQSFFNTLQLTANKRLSRGFSVQTSYTFSKSVDEDSGGSSSQVQYGLARKQERGLSDFDIRHRLNINYFWTLPVGSGQRWLNSGPAAVILGGWRLGGITSFRSGTPGSVVVNVRTPGYLFSPRRPNLSPGASNNSTSGTTAGCLGVEPGERLGTPSLYFDPCAFENPDPGTLGNLGRNTVIGPSVVNTDISLQKDFSIDAKRRLQFRAEMFNLFNHPNFNKPSGNTAVVFSGGAGRRNASAGRMTETATTARQLQFALRFSF